MCTNCCRKARGAPARTTGRHGVQVVVVHDHDPAVAVVAELVEDGLAEQAVDRQVAVAPGVELVLADVGVAGEVPQVVLDEPQHGVGDDVVEEVVGLALGGHVAHLVVSPSRSTRSELAAAASSSSSSLAAAAIHTPGWRAQHGAEHGDEAAGAAGDDRLARRVAVERHRAAVGGHDQVGAFGRRLLRCPQPSPFPARRAGAVGPVQRRYAPSASRSLKMRR